MCGQWKQIILALFLCSLSAISVHAQKPTESPEPKVTGNIVTLTDGYTFEADEVWKEGDEFWYRKGSVRQSIRGQVKSVKPIYEKAKLNPPEVAKTAETAKSAPAKTEPTADLDLPR